MPYNRILSGGLFRADPLVPIGSPIVCKLMRKPFSHLTYYLNEMTFRMTIWSHLLISCYRA